MHASEPVGWDAEEVMRSEAVSGKRIGRKHSQRGRVLGLSAGLALALPCLGWVLLHQVPGLAPAAADSARAVLGDDAVAALEDGLYTVEDSIKRHLHAGESPRAHWHVEAPAVSHGSTLLPMTATTDLEARGGAPPAQDPAPAPFRPLDVGPLYATQRAEGDGVWVAAEPGPARAAPVAFKTLIHPDHERSYAELFVVALDLERVELHAVAGSAEPENETREAHTYARRAAVPAEHRAALLAAFNGGFKSTHGHFGMHVDGVTLAPPKQQACTIANYSDRGLAIGTFGKLSEPERAAWLRQTPRCMVEAGVQHPGLANSRSWGATVDGKTVIRRSAIGLNEARSVLFVGISNSTTAEALARGMQHAGAATVAQLDVNYSFPRFLFYAHTEGGIETVPLARGFVYSEGQYVESRSSRDFFYLTRRSQERGSGARSEERPVAESAPRG